jgi:DNA-binding response OmpR family regulator
MSAKEILHLEDCADLAYSIKFRLENDGYDVRSVSTCRDLIEELERKTPDLLISDVQLPDGNGMDLVRDIRKRRRFDDMPIIVLTACHAADCRLNEIERGANRLLTKPVDPARLLDTVAQLIS